YPRCVGHADADPGVTGLAVLDQLLRDRSGLVDGDGESEPDRALTLWTAGDDSAVDADDLAVHVHQRPTGVTRVDRCVRLHGIDNRVLAALLSALLAGGVRLFYCGDFLVGSGTI